MKSKKLRNLTEFCFGEDQGRYILEIDKKKLSQSIIDIKNFRISSQKQKMSLLNKFNVDFVIAKKFNRAFSKTKSSE